MHEVTPPVTASASARSRRHGGETARTWRLRTALAGLVLGMVVVSFVPGPTLVVALPPLQRVAARDGLDWLSTQDQHIVDSQGRTVLLHGFNSEALLDYAYGPPSTLDGSDATLMERSGFDVVRLPVAWSRLEPQRGVWDTGYLDLVERTVQMLNRHHLWVVLDMHFLDWGPKFGGSGAPYWADVPGVPDWGFGLPDPLNKHASPATFSATAYFFMSSDWQDDFQQAWRMVAARFRDRSGLAGYDLYNEPHPIPIPPRVFEKQYLFPLYARTIANIASVDPNHLFILEGNLFADWGTLIEPMQARNLVWSTHTYTGSLIPPQFTGDATFLRSRISQQVNEASELPAAYWNGELGIDWSQQHATEWTDAALDQLDDLGAGWAWWQWRQDANWGVREQNGTVHQDHLARLARPYLAAAPRGVSAGRGDGIDGTLTVHIGSGVAGVIDIGWPGVTHAPPVAGIADCIGGSAYDTVTGVLHLTLRGGADCSFTVQPSA